MKVLLGGADGENRVKLDRKDKRILYLLSQNCRLPYTRIASLVGLTREGVEYKVKRLIETAVVTGFRTSIDITRLGYSSYHLFLELAGVDEKQMAALVRSLKNDSRIHTIIRYSGRFRFEIALAARNPGQADRILTDVLRSHALFNNAEILVIVSIYKNKVFSKRFFESVETDMVHKRNDGSFTADFRSVKKKVVSLDEKDKGILRILSVDARRSLISIANVCGLSNDAVTYRIRKMIRSGLIRDFRPAINFAALGQSMHAVLLKFRSENEKDESHLKEILYQHENVLWAVKTLGSWNVLVYFIVQHQRELHQTLQDICSACGNKIRSYEVLPAAEQYKYVYIPEAVLDEKED